MAKPATPRKAIRESHSASDTILMHLPVLRDYLMKTDREGRQEFEDHLFAVFNYLRELRSEQEKQAHDRASNKAEP